MFKRIAFLFLIFLSFNIFALSPSKADDDNLSFKANLLYISGKGQTLISPDIAEIVLGVEADGNNASQAQTKVSAILSSFIAQLKIIGIQPNEIKTIENSLSPVRDYSNKKPPYKIISYTALQKIRVRIIGESRLNLISKVIDSATQNSINRIESISFNISPELSKKADKEVLAMASESALETGKEVLNKLGLSLIRIKEIRLSQMNRNYPAPSFSRAKSLMVESAADGTAPEVNNIMPGELWIEGNADLVLEFSK